MHFVLISLILRCMGSHSSEAASLDRSVGRIYPLLNAPQDSSSKVLGQVLLTDMVHRPPLMSWRFMLRLLLNVGYKQQKVLLCNTGMPLQFPNMILCTNRYGNRRYGGNNAVVSGDARQ